jgi:parvulin-like peptidyl-prolyl isomerase
MSRKLFCGFLLFSVFLSSTFGYAADYLVASVSGVPITQFDVKRQVDKVMPFKVSFHSKMPKEKIETIQQEAFEAVIERAYKVCYARDNKITVPEKQIDEALAKIKAYYKTDEAFEQAVAEESEEGLRASIYRELVAKKAETVAVEDRIQVTDETAENYYNENKQSYFMPTQYRASHILVKVDPSSKQEQRKKLEEKATALLARAKSGEDFYNLAYFNSDDRTKYVGGDLGLFHEGRVAKPFEDAIKKLQVGEISDLVYTRWGFHIVRLTEKNDPRQLTFPEMKDKIKDQLAQKQREELTKQWLDDLKAKYVLERAGD